LRIDSVIDELGRIAAAFPADVALAAPDGPVTYAELETGSNQLANRLLEAGAAPGDRVAVVAESSVATITALLAVFKAGCVFVPLDPGAPAARLAAMIDEVSPAWFLAGTELAEAVRGLAARTPGAIVLPFSPGGAGGEEEERDGRRPPAVLGPDDPCYICFTSGSTGRPKGIAGRYKAIGHFIGWEIELLGLGRGARVSQLTTPAFDAFLRDVFTPLCCGGTVCIPPSRETVLDTRRLVEWIDEAGVEVVHCVPSLFRALVNQEPEPGRFAALRAVLMAGEPLLPADVAKWRRIFSDRIRLINLYGPSETTMTKLFYPLQPGDEERRNIPIGKPMAGVRVMLVDERGKPCPAGTVGEIYIRTPYRSLGYYGRPEQTAQVFIPNPFGKDAEDIVYRTGDFGRLLADGNLEFLGRRDHQVKIRGVRVELAEVQSVLRERDGVRDAAVIDREDGEGGKTLCAYYVAEAEISPAELREHCAVRLPEVMVPSTFARLAELPRTLTGKLDRAVLPAPDEARQRVPRVPPRNPLERQLVQIWEEVLNVRPIGVTESFFDLGGHSLLAVRLLARIQRALGPSLPLATLLQAKTVEQLAAVLHAESVKLSPLVEIQAGDPGRKPLFMVHPIGGIVLSYRNLATHLEPGRPVFGLQDPYLEVEGGENIELSIEEMAAEYLAAVRSFQLAGPYLLGGWSFGGIVAFEMAQQLRAAGETVDLLALVDTRPRIVVPDKSDEEILEGIARDMARREGKTFAVSPADLAGVEPARRLDHVLAEMKAADLVAPEMRDGVVRRFLRRRRSSAEAAARYTPRPYAGRVTLFRALAVDPLDGATPEGTARQGGSASSDPTLGWADLSVEPVESHAIPGYHAGLMFEPYVQVLAERLGFCINKAEEAHACPILSS
jgi:amino acid adenylation domain-containing protein